MQVCSTNDLDLAISFKDAIFNGLPQDNGLYIPKEIPRLPHEFFENISNYSFQEIAFQVTQALIGDEIDDRGLKQIIDRSISFDAPIVKVHDNVYSLELFHGPSLAFKDFGARFMASIMSYYLEQEKGKELTILVATSGDTGSAVAQGFLNVPHIKVVILYPSGKVSNIQEKQLTTLGGNITALEVDGTFDDCQRLVKTAFLDQELSKKLNLTSANSINLSRLIPQSFYYFYAYAQLGGQTPVVFSVPSGNFGNLTAGIMAKKMGLPVAKFIASTNINAVIPEYLETGEYNPRKSTKTIANAMDVGNPSNFARLDTVFNHEVDNMRQDIVGYSFNDEEIKVAIKDVYTKHGYTLDPHGAVGYLGVMKYMNENKQQGHDAITTTAGDVRLDQLPAVFLETASPAKFYEDVEEVLQTKISMPQSLQEVLTKAKSSIKITATLDALKDVICG